jgi:excisionase family DNA binding protein
VNLTDCLLTLDEATRRYGVARRTVLAWCRRGDLGCVRAGRRVLFRPADLEAFESARSRPAAPTQGQAIVRAAARRAPLASAERRETP